MASARAKKYAMDCIVLKIISFGKLPVFKSYIFVAKQGEKTHFCMIAHDTDLPVLIENSVQIALSANIVRYGVTTFKHRLY